MGTKKEITYTLESEYIELIKLLKLTNVCQSGGEAKLLVDEQLILCNQTIETRKRYKVRKGDVITSPTHHITIL